MKTRYTKRLTTIYDSYLLKDVPSEIKQIMAKRREKGLPVTRSLKSYIAETKAHNRLYKLHLFRKHTKNTDLEEPIKKLVEIIYFMIGV